MAIESSIIRTNPKFEIILNETSFQIINDADKNDNGTYLYVLTDSLKLKTKKINWFVTGLDVIFGIFADSSFGSLYRDKNRLIVNYNKKRQIILLTDCDIDKANRIIQILKAKLLLKSA